MLDTLNAIFPVRYTALGLAVFGLLLSLFALLAFGVGGGSFLLCTALVAIGMHDLRQTRRAVLRNYPLIGHLRFMPTIAEPDHAKPARPTPTP